MSIFSYEKDAKERHERVCAFHEVYRRKQGSTPDKTSDNYLIDALTAIQKGNIENLSRSIQSYANYVNSDKYKMCIFLAVILYITSDSYGNTITKRQLQSKIIISNIQKYCDDIYFTYLRS